MLPVDSCLQDGEIIQKDSLLFKEVVILRGDKRKRTMLCTRLNVQFSLIHDSIIIVMYVPNVYCDVGFFTFDTPGKNPDEKQED